MPGGSFRQHLGGASPAAGEYGTLSVINSAAQRFENKVLLIERSFVCALSVRRRTAVLLKKQEIYIFDVCSSSVPAMLYYLLTFLVLRMSLLPIALCVRFVVLRDAETRRAWQQHQANVNAAAEAGALRAIHEESARLAGEPKGGRLTSNFYLAKIRDYNLQCLCVKCASTNCCAIKKSRDFYFRCLFDKCTCHVILFTKVCNTTALFAS